MLRLKLFDGVVSPTVTYSFSTTPLTGAHMSMLDTTQREMLRGIVGRVHFDDERWEVTGQRMKARLESAVCRCPIRTWNVVPTAQRERLVQRVQSRSAPWVAQIVFLWIPAVEGHQRGRGRPRQRWLD